MEMRNFPRETIKVIFPWLWLAPRFYIKKAGIHSFTIRPTLMRRSHGILIIMIAATG